MIYLDSNLFIYARVDKGILGKRAREIIKFLEDGKFVAATSCLTIDEVVWVVKEELKSYKKAITYAENIFKIPNLKILSVVQENIIRAIKYMKVQLKPRDAIHAAIALDHGIFTIISEDKDFRILKELNLLDFASFLKKLER